MKFLTEDDLRVEYRQVPFDTFTIKKAQRLTPGARTFLADRKVKVIDENDVTPPSKPRNSSQLVAKQEGIQQETLIFQTDSDWLDLRCEFLQTAVDLASIELALAQELHTLERFLATALSNGECILPPISTGQLAEEMVDKAFVHGNLSNVGMFLQTNNGRILTKLYPLYFHLERRMEGSQWQEETNLSELLNRLGQLIAHYLKTREEVNNDVTTVT